jgi:hypothetical protein
VLTGEQLDPGPVGVGTRFRLVVPFLGRRMTLGPLRILDPILRKGFTAVGDRATAGLARALSAAQPAGGQSSS